MRATSALLAVLGSVREFGTAILRPLGGPAGVISTFIEVQFESSDGRKVRPDGVIRVSRGTKSWTALVEVKTGSSNLGKEQVESYLDVARDNGFDAVLTISNQLASAENVHPVEVDKRKVKKVALYHLSWTEVLSIAVAQRVHRGVSDPDQAWILAELIRYLEHPRSGALDFADMGASWVAVREALSAGTLRTTDKGLAEVVSSWEQLLRFAALRLERELGTGVQVVISRKEQADLALRKARLTEELVNNHVLSGTLRVPNTVGDIEVVADLRGNRCQVCVDVAAPLEGRPQTRVNWLTRQLHDAPDQLRIDAFALNARTSSSELLKVVKANPTVLLLDPNGELRRFRVAATSTLGSKRGTGKGSFIDSVLGSVDGFYELVLQRLRPWQARAPQLPKEGTAVEAAGIDVSVLPGEGGIAIEPSEELNLEKRSNTSEAFEATSEGETEALLVTWDQQMEDLAHERSRIGLPQATVAENASDLRDAPDVQFVVPP